MRAEKPIRGVWGVAAMSFERNGRGVRGVRGDLGDSGWPAESKVSDGEREMSDRAVLDFVRLREKRAREKAPWSLLDELDAASPRPLSLDEDELELELLELLELLDDDDESPKKALIRLNVNPLPDALDPLDDELELLESDEVAAELLLPLLLLLALLLRLPPPFFLRSRLLCSRFAEMKSSSPRKTSPSSKLAGRSFLRTRFCSGAN